MNGWLDKWMDGWLDGLWLDSLDKFYGWIRWIDKFINGETGGWMDGQDGHQDRRLNERKCQEARAMESVH